MTIDRIEPLSDRTLIRIHAPTRYGEPDQYREVLIPHDPDHRTLLPTMSRERFSKPLDDPYGQGVEEMEAVNIERVGTIVFVKTFDTETSSATYRLGSYSVAGPFLLDEVVGDRKE